MYTLNEEERELKTYIPIDVLVQLDKYEKSIKKIIEILKTEDLSVEEIEQYRDLAYEIKKKYRILRGEYDVLYFAYQYFSDLYNPENEGNLIPGKYSLEDAPDFHKELCSMLDSLTADPTKRIAWSVSRGHGKSAYLSNIFPIHQVE